MSEQREPTRWIDAPPADVSSHFVEELEAYRRNGASKEQRQHMWQALEGAALGTSAPASTLGWRWPLLGAGVVMLVLGAGWTVRVIRHSDPTPPSASLSSATRTAMPQQPTAASTREERETRDANTAPSAPDDTSATHDSNGFPRAQHSAVTTRASHSSLRAHDSSSETRGPTSSSPARDAPDSSGRAARASAAVSAQTQAASASAPGASAASSASELSLLVQARRLVRAQPERALQLTEDHRAQFPHGAFVEERELLAIEALSRLDRRTLASERARQFRTQFPGSTHRRRVDELVSPR